MPKKRVEYVVHRVGVLFWKVEGITLVLGHAA